MTGGGTGIGRGIAEAFAVASASSIVITGRREQKLLDTKKYIESKYGVPVSTFKVDVTDADGMRKAAAEVGTWDILIMNAGYLSKLGPTMKQDAEEWWKAFEV